jgi:heptosyltransferase-2
MSKRPKWKKILVRGTNWIGDAVMTLPAIRAIRHSSPDAHISLLVKPLVSDLFRGNRDIDEIILYEEAHSGIKGKIRLAWMLRQKRFDTAILLQNAFDAALITWLAGIPERIGYNRDMRGPLLTGVISVNHNPRNKHQVYYYLNLLRSAGIKAEDAFPYLPLSDKEREDARLLLHSSTASDVASHTIGINPGAAYGPAKRWPAERFALLTDMIIRELRCQVILFGGPAEVSVTDKIVGLVEEDRSYIINLAGKTNIRQLAALISECDAFVTNDSGPMHMASALLTPMVAIFGSTDAESTGPFGEGHRVITKNLPCSPCLKRECPEGHLRCMASITSEEVFSSLKEIIPAKKAVFLDKDGSLIRDMNYLNGFEELEILPKTEESLRQLSSAGFIMIGITNQSGIARGLVDETFVRESNAYLQKKLGIKDFFYCPHLPDDHCQCRKPAPMLLQKARIRHGIDFKKSYMIGDKESDVLLAKTVGAKGILLSEAMQLEITSASYVAQNIDDAVSWILRSARNE